MSVSWLFGDLAFGYFACWPVGMSASCLMGQLLSTAIGINFVSVGLTDIHHKCCFPSES